MHLVVCSYFRQFLVQEKIVIFFFWYTESVQDVTELGEFLFSLTFQSKIFCCSNLTWVWGSIVPPREILWRQKHFFTMSIIKATDLVSNQMTEGWMNYLVRWVAPFCTANRIVTTVITVFFSPSSGIKSIVLLASWGAYSSSQLIFNLFTMSSPVEISYIHFHFHVHARNRYSDAMCCICSANRRKVQ